MGIEWRIVVYRSEKWRTMAEADWITWQVFPEDPDNAAGNLDGSQTEIALMYRRPGNSPV